MPNQATGPSPGQLVPLGMQLFPVLPFPLVIYPEITIRMAPALNPGDQKRWGEIMEQENPMAIALIRRPVLDTPGVRSIMNVIGILVSIKAVDKERFELTGISRAEIFQFIADKKKNLLMVRVKLLEDEPKKIEITKSDQTIVFGSLEAIHSLLIQLFDLLPEKEKLREDVDFIMNYVFKNRRDLDIAYYYLPCFILRDFCFIEDELLDTLLKIMM